MPCRHLETDAECSSSLLKTAYDGVKLDATCWQQYENVSSLCCILFKVNQCISQPSFGSICLNFMLARGTVKQFIALTQFDIKMFLLSLLATDSGEGRRTDKSEYVFIGPVV